MLLPAWFQAQRASLHKKLEERQADLEAKKSALAAVRAGILHHSTYQIYVLSVPPSIRVVAVRCSSSQVCPCRPKLHNSFLQMGVVRHRDCACIDRWPISAVTVPH